MDLLTLPGRALRKAERRLADRFFWERRFEALPEPKVMGPVPYDSEVQGRIVRDLRGAGVAVRELDVDVAGYREYLRTARYERFPRYYRGGEATDFSEKSLEHYLAANLLDLRPADLYIDIANASAPTPDIYHELYDCTVYRQDLSFATGVRGAVIGGDAAAMPVPDGFASKMALHCSFEHFEGDADSRFIREAARVLRPGGKLCILPLYLYETFAVQSDPACLPLRGLAFDEGATIYAARGWGERHGRFYDVPHFLDRVVKHLSGLDLTVYVVPDPAAVAPGCHVKFIALFQQSPLPLGEGWVEGSLA